MGSERKTLLRKLVRVVISLVIFAFGLDLTVKADIGVGPWDVMALGISYHTPLAYGQVLIAVSLLVVLVDLLMHEHIGYGTLLDAVLTGTFVDIYGAMDLVPENLPLYYSVPLYLLGMFIMVWGVYLHMSSGQSSGPRDSFMVGLGKRMPKVPIGAVSIGIQCAVLGSGWLIGGPVGIGTLLSVFVYGLMLQFVCHVMHFEPRQVQHKGLVEATAILLGRSKTKDAAPAKEN